MTGTARRRLPATALVAVMVAVVALTLVATPDVAAAQVDPAHELAERYAPVVFVTPQDAPCDTDGEPFEPAPVDIVLDNPEVFLRQVGNDDPVAVRGPTSSDLFDLREGWYLDFPGDALRPGCIFEQDFHRFYDGESVVYAHIATEPDRPGFIALQYWFFWYHNPAKNDHEGDWEFIQLLFEAESVEAALETAPTSIGYAQHEGGERSRWDNPKLERIGERPVVYPAVGSHASYFSRALFLGRNGHEGFGCDDTSGSTRRLDPSVVLLPDRVTEADDPLAWLAFQGRWGQRESAFFNGPTGPFAKTRWAAPVSWSEGLRNSSVVIPGSDGFGNSVLSTFCDTVELGSTIVAHGVRSPTAALLSFIVAAGLIIAVTRRTVWSPVATAPITAPRAFGQITRAALRVWRDHPGRMAWVGLVYIPVALATSLFQAGVQELPFVDHLVEVAGDRSWVAVFFSVFAGGIGNLLAFVYVSGAVARTMARAERGEQLRAWDWPLGRDDLLALIGAIARASVIVIALLVSIVGIPWGIRQLVRYQLVPQVIAIEGAPPGAALRRSSDLVRRRWWWTAGVIALLQAVIGIAGTASALVVLLLLTSVPLWLFNVLSSLIYVALVPVGAAALTYVYGALAARAASMPDAVDEGTPPPSTEPPAGS